MKKVRLDQLSDAVRSFLDQLEEGGSVIVEDEQGRTRYGVVSYREPSAEDVQRANAWFDRIRHQVGASMEEQGVSEEQIIEEVLKDD